jgi:hypothetical protein
MLKRDCSQVANSFLQAYKKLFLEELGASILAVVTSKSGLSLYVRFVYNVFPMLVFYRYFPVQ